jgi:hypothetical protein
MVHRVRVIKALIFLRIIAGAHTVIHCHGTLARYGYTEQGSQQGGFAGTIGANNDQALPSLDLKVEVAKDHLCAIGFRELVSAQHNLAARGAHGEIDLDAAASLRQARLTHLKCSDALINAMASPVRVR